MPNFRDRRGGHQKDIESRLAGWHYLGTDPLLQDVGVQMQTRNVFGKVSYLIVFQGPEIAHTRIGTILTGLRNAYLDEIKNIAKVGRK